MNFFSRAPHAILKVGDGRGFVVAGRRREERLVVTAGHCLPSLPPCCTFSFVEERTYQRLLGPLDAEHFPLILPVVVRRLPSPFSCNRPRDRLPRSSWGDHGCGGGSSS
jgi:hypothetical protein